jgi:hypothetical protein
MALSPFRKRINIAFGLVLIVFFGALLWPLVSRPFELRSFCSGLQPGMSFSAIRKLADQHGFQMSVPEADVAHIYDFQSLGKFSCSLRMQGGELIQSSFTFVD